MTLLLTTSSGPPLRAVSARVFVPYTGAWLVDLDVDLGELMAAPTGKAVLAIGTSTTLVGTLDERVSGRFAANGKLRLVGGGGGWD